MPNTKSAERRMRNSAAKHARNQSVKSRLRTLERNFLDSLKQGEKGDPGSALRQVHSALDKAAKSGVIPRATADRKKSRLSSRLVPAKAA